METFALLLAILALLALFAIAAQIIARLHGLSFWEVVPRLIYHRIDCPKCGAWRAAQLIGEWDCEMRECTECDYYFEVPYS